DPSVRECAVAAITPPGQETRLGAWVVPRDPDTLDVARLAESLRRRLPETMIPTAFAVVPALLVTRTGKVDRAALAAIPTEPPHAPTDRVPDAFEQRILDVWSDVLGTSVRLDDDFFAIGGHSLL